MTSASRLIPPGRHRPALVLVLALAASWTASGARAPRAEPPEGRKWKLVFDDDFEGTEVDAAKWEKVGDGKRRDAFWLQKSAFLDGKGNLVCRSSKEPDGSFACGGLRSRGKLERAFGYYEIRCKVPDEVGTWAAFWLYAPCVGKVGNGGKDGAEIDIFEAVWRDRDEVNIALHWDGYGEEHRSWAEKVKTPGVNEGFHTFGLLWTPTEYVFYYDGKELRRTDAGGVCEAPLYMKVTTEIGTWAGDIRKAKLPDDFVVDWVRVWDPAEAETKAGASPDPERPAPKEGDSAVDRTPAKTSPGEARREG